MPHTPKFLFERLNYLQNEITDNQQYIDYKKTEFEKDIAPSQSNINSAREEIQKIKESVVCVNLQSFVEELAKLWEAKTSDLDITIVFNTIPGKFEKYNWNEYGNFLHEYFSIPQTMTLLVTDNVNPHKRITTLEAPFPLLALKAPQKDGKTLGALLDLVSEEISPNQFETSFVCKDYRPLIFRMDFNSILEREKSHQQKNGQMSLSTRALISAVEKDKKLEERTK